MLVQCACTWELQINCIFNAHTYTNNNKQQWIRNLDNMEKNGISYLQSWKLLLKCWIRIYVVFRFSFLQPQNKRNKNITNMSIKYSIGNETICFSHLFVGSFFFSFLPHTAFVFILFFHSVQHSLFLLSCLWMIKWMLKKNNPKIKGRENNKPNRITKQKKNMKKNTAELK